MLAPFSMFLRQGEQYQACLYGNKYLMCNYLCVWTYACVGSTLFLINDSKNLSLSSNRDRYNCHAHREVCVIDTSKMKAGEAGIIMNYKDLDGRGGEGRRSFLI